MDNNIYIDLDKLKSSSDIISFINNFLGRFDIKEIIEELEQFIELINFEHGNCINNYKDKMNTIYNDIDLIKEDINKLDNVIKITIDNFDNKTEKKEFVFSNIRTDIKGIDDIINNNTNNNIKKIDKPEIINENNNKIDSSTIGLAIGTAGVTASATAIVINAKKNNKKKKKKHRTDNFEIYKEDFETEDIKINDEYNKSPEKEKIFELKEVYHSVVKNHKVLQDIKLEEDDDIDKEKGEYFE